MGHRYHSSDHLKPFNEGPRVRVEATTMAAPSSAPAVDRKLWHLVTLGVLSFVLHFAWLGHPREVVFDEVHFGKFVRAYCCQGDRFFDIHPPHGKLLLAAAAKTAGFTGDFTFERIGQGYGFHSPWSLRWLSALLGAALPLVIWLVMRQLGASRPIAFLGGLAIALDNALLVQSRMMGLDSLLLVTTFGALCLFLHALKRGTERRSLYMWLAGVVAGLAAGSKFTGLAALALFAVVLARQFVLRRSRENFRFAAKQGLILLLGAAPVYLGGYYLHFRLLDNPGYGDRFYKPKGDFVTDTVNLHKVMLSANYNLAKPHPAASRWWQWPVGRKPIFFWLGKDSTIYLWGNPVLWWGSTFLLLVIAGVGLLGRVTSLRLTNPEAKMRLLQWIPLAGFLLSFLPLVFIPRPLFLYHYFTPLIFATMYVLLWLDGADWVVSSRVSRQRRSYYGVMALLVAGFLLVAPVSYGFRDPLGWNSKLAGFLTNLR